MKTRHLFGWILVLALVAGCRSTRHQFAELESPRTTATPGFTSMAQPLSASWLRAPTNAFTLGPGDKLDIEVMGDTNTLTSTVVGPDGKVYFNLLPGLDVWGLTLPEARALMQRELSQYIRENPQVLINLRAVESKRVWLLGRFQTPGVYPLSAPTTVLEAISLAGGTLNLGANQSVGYGGMEQDLADYTRAFIIRNGTLLPVDFDRLINKGDLTQNIYLEADDFIYLPPSTAKSVYVMGAVLQPQPVPYSSGLTLVGAIAGAYGTIRDAHLANVTVVRGSLAHPQVAVVNYNDIVKGRAPDMALQPGDIVHVPFAPYRYLRRYAEVAVNTFVSSVAINAGTSLMIPGDKQPAGVFIPVGSRVQVIPPIVVPR